MQKRLLLLAGLALWISSVAANADDKDLLKGTGKAPPNVLIVFGNSETTAQPIQGSASAWDGDADSPVSKMAVAKAVLRQFILDNHASYNIGMSAFSHGSDAVSVKLLGKHWLYSPLTVDFPAETWKEPVGTIERWGPIGEGPCYGTGGTVPACAQRLPSSVDPYVALPSGVAGPIGPFFGVPTDSAFIYLDGTTDNKGQPKNATKRIQVTLGTTPACSGKCKYGDAFTDGTLSTYTLGDHSMEVTKVYQVLIGGNWLPQAFTPHGDPGAVTVAYVPAATLTPDLFYTTSPDAGKEIGFLNDDLLIPIQNRDLNVNATCSGWEFQSNNATTPLVKIPRDYKWGATCGPPQDSLPCLNRLLRPQARLVSYNQGTGVFTPNDYDNPGYLTGVDADKYADGCDKNLLGAVDTGNLNVIGRQAILQTQNGSQVPLKNLLSNIYDYFTNQKIDGFQNGTRLDDPNATCRTSAVILIYDSFNGCQGDACDASVIKNVEKPFDDIKVPVFVIGFGSSAEETSAQGICIAHNTGTGRFMPGGIDGYFWVKDASGLSLVLSEIVSVLNQSPQTFSAAAVSTTQAQGDQMAFFASFSPTSERSIWDGRLNGYKLDPTTGQVQTCRSLLASPPVKCADNLGQFTIKDPKDPHLNATIPVPSNASLLSNPSNPSLIWNAGENLHATPGTGATDPNAILKPGVSTIAHGSYSDFSNDANTTVPTNFYPGRKIVFSLPQGYASPVLTLPIPATNLVPETRRDMIFPTCPSDPACTTWWPDLKALLGPQTAPPDVLSPPLTDTDAGNSLRFIWGDRDAVTGAKDAAQYLGQKLGDIVHSGPLLVGNPNDFALFKTNASGYQTFSNAYKNRRRVLCVGANDGLLHAFDAGAVGRDTSQPTAYDLGTGAELFAFAPRSIMQIYKPLKDAVGPQTKRDEWTVDLPTSAADVFIDAGHSGTPDSGNRAWHTVLVGGVREGSPFEGTDGAAPRHSQGSYFALDITQPDEIVGGFESPGTFTAPKCLNKTGDPSCARDWPTVLWEITDTDDADTNGAPDMGETWSKASMGRIKVCTANCGTSTAVTEDHYVTIFGGGFDRERLNTACAPACNRRGAWLYMVDVETGFALYKVNSSCGVNGGSGCIFFGSIPSGPAALDYDGDGYLDVVYVGDLKGQLWRIDLTDLRKLSSPPSSRFDNKLDLISGTGKPFLFFQAPQPASSATTPFYPIYHRPEAITLGYNAGGKPALGIAFGTGDRDDITAKVDPPSLNYAQRFYYVVDAANTTTRTESDLYNIASPTAATTSSVPANGWFLQLINGERLVGDSFTVGGIIRFPTFNPPAPTPVGTIPPCANIDKCGALASGVSRLYQVFYNTGNPYPIGATDRGQTQENATFITSVTGYIAGTGGASGIFWSGGVQNPPLGVGRKITVRSWKEKLSPP